MTMRLLLVSIASGLVACAPAYTPLKGSLLDESGAPIPGGKVELVGTTLATTVDASGRYAFDKNQLAGDLVLRFSAEGYAPSFLRAQVDPDAPAELSAKLRKRAPVQNVVLPPVGQTVSVPAGLNQIIIHGGALCREGGTPATGTIQVQLTSFEPWKADVVGATPTDEAGKVVPFATMAEIDFSQDGARLQSCNGEGIDLAAKLVSYIDDVQARQLRFKVLDLTTGRWKPAADGSYDPATRTLNAPLKMLEPHCEYAYTYSGPPLAVIGTVFAPNGRGVQTTVTAGGVTTTDVIVEYWDGSNPPTFSNQQTIRGDLRVRTDATGNYAYSFNAFDATLSLTAAAPANMRLLDPRPSTTYGQGTTRVDLHLCWIPNAKCVRGDTCCDGKTCQDGTCN